MVVIGTWPTCAPGPGPAAEEAGTEEAGSPTAVRTNEAGLTDAVVSVAVVLESHINGGGLVYATEPSGPLAVMPPDEVGARSSPLVSIVTASLRTRGSVAAFASCTTSTSLKPPWSVTDTDRSTPGSTAA